MNCGITMVMEDGLSTFDINDTGEETAAEFTTLTYEQVYQKLLEVEDITIDLPGEQVALLRKGLSNVKAKNNAKLKQNDLPIDDRRVEFKVIKEDVTARLTTLKIWLSEKDTVQIKNLRVSKGLEET